MTQRSVEHSTIVLERTYDAAPARVFAAWSSEEALLRWACPGGGWGGGIDRLDFSVGGGERSWFRPHEGDTYVNETVYLDIVQDRRIVSAGVMTRGDTRIFVGLLTVEFDAIGDNRCRMTVTEYGAFLDGHDVPANHQAGWGKMLDNLAEEISRERAAA
jgi:uncharacterized protein YndB with AHSA1/START domain